MRYKGKWRAGGEEPIAPELFDGDGPAKAHVRELLEKHGGRVTIDVWNEDETWRIIAPPGIVEWCKKEDPMPLAAVPELGRRGPLQKDWLERQPG